MELHLQQGAELRKVQAIQRGDALELRADGLESTQAHILASDRSTLLLEIDGRRHTVRWARSRNQLHLHLRGSVVRIRMLDDDQAEGASADAASPRVVAPMPGRVLEVLVAAGDTVEAGQPLVRLEAMKMEVDLEATLRGRVQTIHVATGDFVEPEEVVVTLEPDDSAPEES